MVEVIRRAGTGLERDACWRSQTAPGTQGPDEMLLLTGNSANAEIAAKERVNTVCGSHIYARGCTFLTLIQARAGRVELFNKGEINLSRYLADSLIGDGKSSVTPAHLPLEPSVWAFIYWDGGVYVAKGIIYSTGLRIPLTPLSVLAFYSKEAGSGNRHAWQASTSAISNLSYLVVQVFEKTTPSRFHLIHLSKAGIRANTYLHLPSIQFLCRLQGEVTFTDPQTILITETDWMTFPRLSKSSSALGSAFKELNGGSKGKKKA